MTDQPITTKKIKERLRKYTNLLREISNQLERLSLMETAEGIMPKPNLSGMPRPQGGISNPTAAAAERKTDLEKKIKRKEAEEKTERLAIESMTERLANPDERLVIQLKYIDGASWPSITFALFGCSVDYLEKLEAYQRRTYRIHGRALINLAKIDAGISDSDQAQSDSE